MQNKISIIYDSRKQIFKWFRQKTFKITLLNAVKTDVRSCVNNVILALNTEFYPV